MRNQIPLIAAFLLFTFAGQHQLHAQEPGRDIAVTADRMRSMPDGSLVAEGDVVVRGEGVTVRADRLEYDPGSDTLMLSGNVVMEEEGGGAFTGDALALDLEDLTGGISRGEIIIVPNGFRVRGEDISRTGPEEYTIRKGVFTSCPGDCPDWSFTASRIQVRKEGYLEARHAAFRILGVPVFYTPYLLYPVKTRRQSGLLFPEIGFSDETGLESRWPLFITLGPHADATVSPRTFSRDGFGLDLQSRYALHWGGGGTVEGFTMTGEGQERWYVRADHSIPLTRDLWFRGRWYDTGEPSAAALFGDDFSDRYPGAFLRHAALEGEHGLFGYNIAASSLLADGSLARSGTDTNEIRRDQALVRFGPGGGDLWRAGIEAEATRFGNGDERTLVSPSLSFRIPGPWKLAGNLRGKAIISTGGSGSQEDEAYLVSWTEKTAMESAGDWGRHRVTLDLTASAAQSGAFGESVVRDSMDLVQERKILDVRASSLLMSSGFTWELTAGGWRDEELDLALNYGRMVLSYAGMFVEASRNRDAYFGLVLPSITVDEGSLRGWQVEAGYESDSLGVSIGRDSAEGFPEMLKGKGHFKLGKISVSGESFYDMDAETVADETIGVRIPGRCWVMGVKRSRSPDRTDWSLQLELGL